jgi:hypothetical protein
MLSVKWVVPQSVSWSATANVFGSITVEFTGMVDNHDFLDAKEGVKSEDLVQVRGYMSTHIAHDKHSI